MTPVSISRSPTSLFAASNQPQPQPPPQSHPTCPSPAQLLLLSGSRPNAGTFSPTATFSSAANGMDTASISAHRRRPVSSSISHNGASGGVPSSRSFSHRLSSTVRSTAGGRLDATLIAAAGVGAPLNATSASPSSAPAPSSFLSSSLQSYAPIRQLTVPSTAPWSVGSWWSSRRVLIPSFIFPQSRAASLRSLLSSLGCAVLDEWSDGAVDVCVVDEEDARREIQAASRHIAPASASTASSAGPPSPASLLLPPANAAPAQSSLSLSTTLSHLRKARSSSVPTLSLSSVLLAGQALLTAGIGQPEPESRHATITLTSLSDSHAPHSRTFKCDDSGLPSHPLLWLSAPKHTSPFTRPRRSKNWPQTREANKQKQPQTPPQTTATEKYRLRMEEAARERERERTGRHMCEVCAVQFSGSVEAHLSDESHARKQREQNWTPLIQLAQRLNKQRQEFDQQWRAQQHDRTNAAPLMSTSEQDSPVDTFLRSATDSNIRSARRSASGLCVWYSSDPPPARCFANLYADDVLWGAPRHLHRTLARNNELHRRDYSAAAPSGSTEQPQHSNHAAPEQTWPTAQSRSAEAADSSALLALHTAQDDQQLDQQNRIGATTDANEQATTRPAAERAEESSNDQQQQQMRPPPVDMAPRDASGECSRTQLVDQQHVSQSADSAAGAPSAKSIDIKAADEIAQERVDTPSPARRALREEPWPHEEGGDSGSGSGGSRSGAVTESINKLQSAQSSPERRRSAPPSSSAHSKRRRLCGAARELLSLEQSDQRWAKVAPVELTALSRTRSGRLRSRTASQDSQQHFSASSPHNDFDFTCPLLFPLSGTPRRAVTRTALRKSGQSGDDLLHVAALFDATDITQFMHFQGTKRGKTQRADRMADQWD